MAKRQREQEKKRKSQEKIQRRQQRKLNPTDNSSSENEPYSGGSSP
jgi:hypothetical protein